MGITVGLYKFNPVGYPIVFSIALVGNTAIRCVSWCFLWSYQTEQYEAKEMNAGTLERYYSHICICLEQWLMIFTQNQAIPPN